MQVGSGYSPRLLEGMDHVKLKAEVENPTSSLSKAIKTESDHITALICKNIGGRANICTLQDIRTLIEKV